ncbi:hypothetical protein A2714_05435 [Candidatus Woesebacteria bacterium RIFCSPHIGHO2_01_FULL_38_9]|uniref:Toxin n=2 Tax=Candidatus Woeseibacteriota TaxID=1752722 RepID=A0A1F7Y4Z2_9BACT|nr:MAG: hypothetical protein A2714_05435 [Candidatus Woesebacteria bacterium RIFCSPHIGHO2_01_FULL_38_9]OGM59096.1 MAG: hypothetical protein A3A75_05555 [Candidatus Woesebacteria bacterium RIFCSPLOWO2_01_FULL_39_10]
MLVPDLSKIKGFQWDKGNVEKSYLKHGISIKKAEEIFLDVKLLLLEDIKHSQKEERFIAIGETIQNKILFAVFTVRGDKVRIISIRNANKKERIQYEK